MGQPVVRSIESLELRNRTSNKLQLSLAEVQATGSPPKVIGGGPADHAATKGSKECGN